ncbi:hypothetical protein HK102_001863 [Quaeritorhiza haematococci]|nr:hypothetical protein HK102_001863 [Quaeritorhiza haematococci]
MASTTRPSKTSVQTPEQCLARIQAEFDRSLARSHESFRGKEMKHALGITSELKSAQSQYALAVVLDRRGIEKPAVATEGQAGGVGGASGKPAGARNEARDEAWALMVSAGKADFEGVDSKEAMSEVQRFLDEQTRLMEGSQIEKHGLVPADSAAAHCERAAAHHHSAMEMLGYEEPRSVPVTTVEAKEATEERRRKGEEIIARLKAEVSKAMEEEGVRPEHTARHGDISSKIMSAAMHYAQCLAAERQDETAESIMNRVPKSHSPEAVTLAARFELLPILIAEAKKRQKAERDVHITIGHGTPAAHATSAADHYAEAMNAYRVGKGFVFPLESAAVGAEKVFLGDIPCGPIVSEERKEEQNDIIARLKAVHAVHVKREGGTPKPDGPASHLSSAENHYADAVALDRNISLEALQQMVHKAAQQQATPVIEKYLLDQLDEEARRMTMDEIDCHGFVSAKGKAFHAQMAAEEYRIVMSKAVGPTEE